MEFEWDETKSQSNKAKHGLALEEACALWDAPALMVDSGHEREERRLAIGKLHGKHWTVVFTMRGKAHRLISARRSPGRRKENLQ